MYLNHKIISKKSKLKLIGKIVSNKNISMIRKQSISICHRGGRENPNDKLATGM